MQDTQVFLRMAAIELRRIAEQAADDIAADLRHVVQQLEAEAEDLARHDTDKLMRRIEAGHASIGEEGAQCFTLSK
jgi:F0F1-type ATP synthase membrane subunit b/b'